MNASHVSADHHGDLVALRSEDHEKLALMTPEDAIKLAHSLLDEADKVLAHQGIIDDDD